MNVIRRIDQMMMSSSSEDEDEFEQRVRRPYHLFQRSTVDSYDDVDFHKYFRLHKSAFWRLHDMIRADIDGDTRRYVRSFRSCISFLFLFQYSIYFLSSRELTAEQKLLAVLRFLACGNFQQTAGDYIGVAQATVCKVLSPVCDAILKHMNTFVRMPRSPQECFAKAIAFADIADFPQCIGAIDCTHVKIASPGGDIVSSVAEALKKIISNLSFIHCTE